MGLEGGAGRRTKRSQSKLARTGALFLVVAAAEGVLVGSLDLNGSAVRTTPTPRDQAVPYFLTTERSPAPALKAPTAETRPPKKRKPAAALAGGPPSTPAANVTPPAPAAFAGSASTAAAPPAPDYGRWTVAPGVWPEAGQGKIVMSVCDPANLANLPADARKACTETLKSASASGPPVRRSAAADWKTHSPLSCEPKYEPAHKWLLDHCSGVGTGVGLRLKYKF